MTYRERRERRAERLRGWADTRQARAAATFAAHEVYRDDYAFNTQPGHIPERARVIAREDRAHESLQKAARMDERAGNIEAQLDHAIYSDDPDAIERLEERLATLEAERDRIKAFNVTARKGQPNESLLNDQERASLDSERRFSGAYMERRKGQFPAYHLANLNRNITRQRARLEGLKRRAGIPEPPRELVTHGVGEGLRGYVSKVAVIRAGDSPIGEFGPLYLNCPCGAKPATRLDLDAPDVVCACGV